MSNTKLVEASINEIVQKEKQTNVFREKLANILAIPMPKKMKEDLDIHGLHLQNANIADAITASLVIQAMSGNIAAYTTIRDTMGYKPIEQIKNDVVVRIEMSPEARKLGE